MKIILPAQTTVITYQAGRSPREARLSRLLPDDWRPRRLRCTPFWHEKETAPTPAVRGNRMATAQHLISIPITVRARSGIESSFIVLHHKSTGFYIDILCISLVNTKKKVHWSTELVFNKHKQLWGSLKIVVQQRHYKNMACNNIYNTL